MLRNSHIDITLRDDVSTICSNLNYRVALKSDFHYIVNHDDDVLK